MDKRKTQRILGILIIIALLIILFPLLFSKNEVVTKTASVEAPAFPDQQNTASSSPSPQEVASAATTDTTVPVTPVTDESNPTVVDTTQANAAPTQMEEDTAPKPEENTIQPVAAAPEKPVEPAEEVIHEPTAANTPTNEETIIEPQQAKPIKTSKAKKKQQELANLNKPAWIVQMGSFKSKDNARNLTDKLRAAGYNAFTKETQSASGVRTRVYIGPSFKEAEASKISQKIQHDLNMPSIVLPYKPLAL